MVKVLTAIALSLSLAANSPTPPAKAADKAAVQQDNRRYCITLEPSTESRISKTRCMTKSQWAEEGVNVDETLRK